MAGKAIIHGFNQGFIAGGIVTIVLNGEKAGTVDQKGTAEIRFDGESTLVLKCGINPMKGKVTLQDGMVTEIQCKYNRLTGAVQAEVLSTVPYESAEADAARAQAMEQPLDMLDGGAKDILYLYEDHVVISHRGALNALSMGIKGDKTIYYTDITSVQYKKPALAAGYLQFSLPGGKEDRGGVFSALSDENTITLKAGDGRITAKAEQVLEILNQKIREAKSGAHAAATVVQQTSAADEIKKFKELVDMGVITQEEFDAKKKQLLGL